MDILKTVDIIEALEGFLDKRRPPLEIRKQVDIEYRIEGESILLLELRPAWNDPDRIVERGIVKGTYIKSKDHWKIFWMRADMKWHGYKPYPTARTLKEFIDVVVADSHNCFWG